MTFFLQSVLSCQAHDVLIHIMCTPSYPYIPGDCPISLTVWKNIYCYLTGGWFIWRQEWVDWNLLGPGCFEAFLPWKLEICQCRRCKYMWRYYHVHLLPREGWVWGAMDGCIFKIILLGQNSESGKNKQLIAKPWKSRLKQERIHGRISRESYQEVIFFGGGVFHGMLPFGGYNENRFYGFS